VNRAECLLALYMMTEEQGQAVEFLDSDRLEVLGAVGEKLSREEVDGLFDAQLADPVQRIAARRSFPAWMVEQWVAQLGEDGADAMAARLNERPPTTLR
jgi:16S rRNA C967 or C1407 C5-methylase (RsmB/RsmF family)